MASKQREVLLPTGITSWSSLTPNVEDAADQLGHGINRVDPIAFVIIPLARNVGVAIPIIGGEAAVIDIAIIAPR